LHSNQTVDLLDFLAKEGDRLIVEPIRKGRLLALLASLDPLTEPFPDIDDDLAPLDDVTL
jgi:antitoxin VapB